MAEYQVDTTSAFIEAHNDCAFVCELLRHYPCAAYEAYKNAPARVQANIDVAQTYLESRQAHSPKIYLPDHEKARIAAGNTFAPEGEALLAELLNRFHFYTFNFDRTAEAAFAMMKTERSEGVKKEITPGELPTFD